MRLEEVVIRQEGRQLNDLEGEIEEAEVHENQGDVGDNVITRGHSSILVFDEHRSNCLHGGECTSLER